MLYAYDRVKNGGTPQSNEYNGFSLKDNKLYYRTFGDNLNNCEMKIDNRWVELTDNTIKITKLQFCYLDATSDAKGKMLPPDNCKLLPSGGKKINNIVLYLEAELTADSSVKSKYIEVIRLYNSPINAS